MRITGGMLKNRKLAVPAIAAVRPTSEKMRQAVFNLLAHAGWGLDIAGARVLDGFCGSGIMGLEAFSRGAAHVAFADRDAAVLSFLKGQLADLKIPSTACALHRADLTASVPGGPYDLVFLDPPYRKDMIAPALAALAAKTAVAPGALVLFEAEKSYRPDIDAALFTVEDVRAYGDSQLIALRCAGLDAEK